MSYGTPDVPPSVLCFATSDATGGGGLQSDVLTLASMGCHPLTVVAAVAVRDTRGIEELFALDADAVAAQARAVLEDIPVHAFKLGLIGNVENVAAIAEILSDYPDLPLVLEPALSYAEGDEGAADEMLAALAELVLPQVTVLVASRHEVLRLALASLEDADADADTDEQLVLEDAVAHLLELGLEYVLLTGAGEPGPQVVNILMGAGGVVRTDAWERLPGRFLGAGATLAGAVAAALAHGMEVPEAVREAQEFTFQALTGAYRPGMGLALPDRFFWARPEERDDA
ncbi:bifunctional hydroxymethylpyrimidine kinase/phosphomethylpyrimidine kinase [Aromatoleum aromaticum]|uniref:bifunctional hydroxymethylpyrimidine kinase/phosphomethylpyrimidine kinase n=1 Tax=Aromatoleum aromaticum TaxID=551760 RepID=UPI0014596D53|nr:bifunctional hydroxymethylpyrimidine kinase/phosphomethylpyrimidine kinase [Aromatoleum aromaticum]NMG55123.1 hydroxymethylpyrimidine/phosphomethylpyrimidine kinase [Aromatoleum aromaticum]